MKKIKNGKLVGGIAAGFAAIAVAGVGFATWIITGTTTGEVTGINVSVGDVEDKRVAIENAAVSSSDNSVSFDAKYVDGAVLNSSDKTNHEDLTFTLTFDVCANVSNQIKVSAYIKDYTTESGLGKAVAANYIALPSTLGTAADGNVVSTYTTTAASTGSYSYRYSATATFTFAWGSVFGTKNPTDYATSSNVNEVITNLKALKACNAESFTVVLVPELVTA